MGVISWTIKYPTVHESSFVVSENGNDIVIGTNQATQSLQYTAISPINIDTTLQFRELVEGFQEWAIRIVMERLHIPRGVELVQTIEWEYKSNDESVLKIGGPGQKVTAKVDLSTPDRPVTLSITAGTGPLTVATTLRTARELLEWIDRDYRI